MSEQVTINNSLEWGGNRIDLNNKINMNHCCVEILLV